MSMNVNVSSIQQPVRPVGLLTEAEYTERHRQMRRLAGAAFPVSNQLNAALGGLLSSAVMGPGPGVIQEPEDVRQEIRVDIEADQGIAMNVTHAFIMSPQYIVGATEAIARLIEGQVTKAKMRIVHDINLHMTGHGHPEMIPAITQILTQQAGIITHLQELEASEIAKASLGSATSRSKLSHDRQVAESTFDQMTEHNDRQISSIASCKTQIIDIERERSLIEGGNLNELRANRDQLKELSDLQRIAERRKARSEKELLDFYVPDPGNDLEHKNYHSGKTVHLIPLGLEKGKGSEMGTKATLWSKSQIKNTSTIHRFILKIMSSLDPEQGSFWKPPLKGDVSTVVPRIETDRYNRQNQWLFDQLEGGLCPHELMKVVLRPAMKGYYNNIPVLAEEGNGLSILWALMMHFRKCNETHCLALVDCLESSKNLFRSPKSNIATSVKQVAEVLKECIDLGVQVPWKNTGRPVAAILRSKGYSSYLFPFRYGGVDPQDSAPHYMQMLEAIETATPDVEEVLSENPNRRLLQANEASVFSLISTDETASKSYKVVEEPNPLFESSIIPSQSEQPSLQAYEAQRWANDEDENWAGGEEQWVIEYNNPYSPTYHAHDIRSFQEGFTRGKGGLKGGKTSKGSKGGKMAFGSKGSKQGKGKSKGSPKGGRGFTRHPEGTPCPIVDCRYYANPPHTYCYPCSVKGRQQGFLVKKDGSRIEVPPAARAFEACEWSEELADNNGYDWPEPSLYPEYHTNNNTPEATQNPQDTPSPQTTYNAYAASAGPPMPAIAMPQQEQVTRDSPAADLQEMWRQHAMRRDWLRQTNPR